MQHTLHWSGVFVFIFAKIAALQYLLYCVHPKPRRPTYANHYPHPITAIQKSTIIRFTTSGAASSHHLGVTELSYRSEQGAKGATVLIELECYNGNGNIATGYKQEVTT